MIFNSQYREMVAVKDQIIAEKNAEILELKSALHKLEDVILVNNFGGVAIWGTIPEVPAAPKPSVEAPEIESAPADVPWSEDDSDIKAQLAAARRRAPSKVGPLMEKLKTRQVIRELHTRIHGAPESKAAFQEAVGAN